MSTFIEAGAFASMSRFYRANLLNSLSGYKSVSLIGTISPEGRTNLGVFSNIVHLGADPALVGFINRPREAAPHTISHIEANGWYTINHIHNGMLEQAHACSAKWPDEVSEFSATGLTPCYQTGIPAPFVQESRIGYALELVEIVPIKWNGTFLVIGAVKGIRIEDLPNTIAQDGFLNLDQAGSLTSLGLDGYVCPGAAQRLPYAKPANNTPLSSGKPAS